MAGSITITRYGRGVRFCIPDWAFLLIYVLQWQNGRRGQDGWGRWTRRRKWYRDAELVEIGSDEEPEEIEAAGTHGRETPSTPMMSSEAPPSLPPRPQHSSPLVPSDSPSIADATGDRKGETLEGIKEESEDHVEGSDKGADDVSVLSTSSRSMRFKMPSLRRRVTDSSSKQHQQNETNSVTSSPVSIAGKGSRRTSETHSEDDAASIERAMGLSGPRNRVESWGFGDELVMGLD